MYVADLIKEISSDLLKTYSIPWDTYVIEAEEGDINIEAVPSHKEHTCVLGFRLYLGYTRFAMELSVINAPPMMTSVFTSIENNIKKSLPQAIAMGKLLLENGEILYTINNHKYTNDDLYKIKDSSWFSISVRFNSGYTNVYDKLDFNYQSFRSQVIAFAGLILLYSIPKETIEPILSKEGKEYSYNGSRYERNPINREICLASKGFKCSVCGINMEDFYGEIGKGYIEVHHVIPVSEYGMERLIDPLVELVPVCPNCHSMLHRRKPPYSIDELKEIIKNTTGGMK